MQDEFLTASTSRPVAVGNTYEGPTAPFEGFEVPAPVAALHEHLERQKIYNFQGLTLYGGAVYDQYLGRRAKDFDLYVSCPEFVDKIETLLSKPRASYRDMHDENEVMASLVGMFGLQEDDGAASLRRIRLQNKFDNVSLSGDFYHGDDVCRMDIRVGRALLPPRYISSITSTPAVSAVVQIADGEATFAYHKDTMAHLKSRILVATDPRDDAQLAYLAVLAKTKGFQVINAWGGKGPKPAI
jgi:hypothetical protein